MQEEGGLAEQGAERGHEEQSVQEGGGLAEQGAERDQEEQSLQEEGGLAEWGVKQSVKVERSRCKCKHKTTTMKKELGEPPNKRQTRRNTKLPAWSKSINAQHPFMPDETHKTI